MRSRLVITTPAEDLSLLTIDELRQAADVTGSGSDVELTAMGLAIAAAIATECNIAVGRHDDGVPPTLRQERLTETFWSACTGSLVLARRHNIAIVSIVEDGTALSTSDYEFDPESGIGMRLYSDCPGTWRGQKITVVYDAGFEIVPADLKEAASDFMAINWREGQRDPLVKSERVKVDDIEETEVSYWVGTVPGEGGGGAVPDAVAGKLARFRNMAIA